MSARRGFTAAALDPARSVVVEACAGSGKTWLLVSRLIRLLLAGARPGDVLAITYTRKAAREIEERLRRWLRELATGTDAFVDQFLLERGLSPAQATAQRETARSLYERLLSADPPPTITTFHGWFARILQGAPLDSGLAGFAVGESSARLLDEAWARLARRCGRQRDLPEAQALAKLFDELGLFNTRQLLNAFIDKRAEWQAWCADDAPGQGVVPSLARLQELMEVAPEPLALARFLGRAALADEVDEYARLLGPGSAGEQGQAVALAGAFAQGDAELRFAALRAALLTQKDEPRARKLTKASVKRLGAAGAERLVELHGQLVERMQVALAALEEERQYRINCAAQCAGEALRHEFEAIKRARRTLDFSDLEWQVDRLLADPSRAPFVLARLDARYRHILLDEFQDTNPLQWRILDAWLSAYGGDAERPQLFVVGDPKQSIYRFRRADFRIFAHAAEWLRANFAASCLDNDTTYRNAPTVVEVVNTVFAAEPGFAGFRAQVAQREGLPGRVELLPLIAADAEEGAAEGAVEGADGEADLGNSAAQRNPLLAPRLIAADLRRRREAQALVGRLSGLIGRVEVEVDGRRRPAGWGDVMLLTRRRAALPEFERALREAGVSYLSVSRGGLLQTLEARDLLALLRVLVTPSDDLALAHLLRTPIFALPDEELMRLALRPEGDWWSRLQALPAGQSPALDAAREQIAGWMGLARALPAHDLLDKVFHQGRVMARYRASVPAPMWPGVCANLEAFIALALEVDGGRYPSLTRFVDELVRRARPEDDEAPDEGLLPGDGQQGDRLRLLTVHGAKGLEAPIVWLVDAAANRERADVYQPLIEWPPGAAAPTHFSLFTSRGAIGPHRAPIAEREDAAARRERLNLLYVAITRASQYFFASGVAPRGDASETDYERLRRAIEVLAGEGALAWGEFAEAAAVPLAGAPPLTIAAPTCAQPPPAVGVRRAAPVESAEIDFGLQLHAWLEAATQPGSPPPAGGEAVQAMAERILAAPELQRFFAPGEYQRAGNEVPFLRPDGSMGRIDRLVWRADGLWILDYKSGSIDSERLAEYRAQLEDYRAALGSMWPGQAIHCVLVFGDSSHVAW